MNTNQKIEEVELEIMECKDQVSAVIINVLERGDKLEELEEKSNQLVNSASLFSKQAKKIERKMCCQEYKGILLLVFMILCILGFISLLLYYEFK